MKAFFVLGLFSLWSCSMHAQQLLPPEPAPAQINDALAQLFYASEKKDSIAIGKTILNMEQSLAPLQAAYPAFTGMVYLHLSYYEPLQVQRNNKMQHAIALFENQDSMVVAFFAEQFAWLIQSFHTDGRQKDWAPADSIYRKMANGKANPLQQPHALLNIAKAALTQKNFIAVKALARYEQYYYKAIEMPAHWQRTNALYASWLSLAQQLEQWKQLSFAEQTGNQYHMNAGQVVPDFLDKKSNNSIVQFNYNDAFKKLLEQLEALKKDFITHNHRTDKSYNEANRKNYFFLANTILQDYYNWATHSQNESRPLLYLKEYLWDDVRDELEDAKAHKQKPLIPLHTLANAYVNLSALYHAIGNANQAIEALMEGLRYFLKNELLSIDEQLNVLAFYPAYVNAYRAAGNYTKAQDAAKRWLALTKNPDSVNEKNITELDQHFNAKMENAYTLMEMGHYDEAKDSTIKIIDELNAVVWQNEQLVYGTVSWVKLQLITANIAAQNGKWDTQLIKENLSDQMLNHPGLSILYPAHLLLLKAEWKNNKKIDEDYLGNLLRYTSRQLYGNFPVLNAQERMQYFSTRLQEYFDVYHQLLFEGALNAWPQLKNEVISQSMHLKSSLADGNSIPDAWFTDYAKNNPGYLNQLRELRQKVILANDEAKFYNKNNGSGFLNDQFQQLWMRALSQSDGHLQKPMQWPVLIDSVLKSGQVYMETIRYKNWLSDSSYTYGAYIIQKNKPLQLISLCSEAALMQLLSNAAASPQSASIASFTGRGTIVLGKKNPQQAVFKTSDKDQLASLLLSPLEPYIHAKEWILVNDGLLNRISFGALLYQNKYLTELLQLRLLTSAAQLTRVPTTPINKKILLAGDIQYGEPGNNMQSLMPNLKWQYLPGTKKEITALQKQMQQKGYQVSLVTGNQFADSIYRHFKNHSIIHLATHGFYIKATDAPKYFNNTLDTAAIKTEPLFRSGLVASNAHIGNSKKEKTPGYIMGYELANTDLRNCYLIALSACETGLGDIKNNMGVDGLGRALKIGGAQNLLISLWSVPDEPTSVFMQQFYKELFNGHTPTVALRNTQLKMCRQYKAPEWAAFVLVE